MSALALLGGFSGGGGGQSFGNAGPSSAGGSRSGFSGGVGGLNFAPNDPGNTQYIWAGVAVVVIIGFALWRR